MEFDPGTELQADFFSPDLNLGGQFRGFESPEIIKRGSTRPGAHDLPPWTRTIRSLLLPGGAWLLGAILLAWSGWLILAPPALTFLCYCALIGGMLLAWRFHSSRIFFSLLILLLSQQAISVFGAAPSVHTGSGSAALQAVAVLLPINFILIALMHERGFNLASAAPVALLFFLESVVVAVFGGSAPAVPSQSVRARHLTAAFSLPGYAMYIAIAAGLFLLVRFLITRKPADSGLFWSLPTFFFALHFAATPRLSILYSTASACILATSIIENSYLLAYHDELTTLPSRRAFNDALLRLQNPYSIAAVDIDHFKRFNDTYGHDTGDEVLKLVAANLSRVTGGGQAYRCGGEEFMILFSGKTTSEVADHLERLRIAIQDTEFRMRGGDRRHAPRTGPDRRNEAQQGRSRRKGDAIRQLAIEKPVDQQLSVTVSIGVATSPDEHSNPEVVIKSADKALYRAKANGRNRLETAAVKRRSRRKAAGIA
jgi:diguanylate cyclase (GGDEF)-like protein